MALISFEGIDGSGKSTLIEKVENSIKNSLVTREPRGTKLGYEILKVISNSMEGEKIINGKRTNLFLFLASHAEHVDSVINPALKDGKTVLVDRYIDSMFANQCLDKNLEVDKLVFVLKNLVNSPMPEVTFILDVDPAIAQERINKRKDETSNYTSFDSMKASHHEKIRKYFYKLNEIFPNRIVLINANKNPDEVFNEVMKTLKEKDILS